MLTLHVSASARVVLVVSTLVGVCGAAQGAQSTAAPFAPPLKLAVQGKLAPTGSAATPSTTPRAPQGPASLPLVSNCTPEWLPTFGPGPGLNDDAFCALYFNDGSGNALYVGGNFTESTGNPARFLAKWDGENWSQVGASPNDNVHALTAAFIGGSVQLVAAGEFTSIGGVSANRIARWNGTTWAQIGSGFNGAVYALEAYFSDIYAGGAFTASGGTALNRVARSSGGAWSSFGGGVNGTVRSFELTYSSVDLTPILLMGGEFTSTGGGAANRIAAWGFGPSIWYGFGGGLNGTVRGIELGGPGSTFDLYVVGDFTTAAGASAARIAKYELSTGVWSGVGGGFNSTARAVKEHDDGGGYELWVGGSFTTVAGVPADYLARWNGSNWSIAGGEPNSTVHALVEADTGAGTQLHIVGDFTSAGGYNAERVARWNAQHWSSLGDAISGPVFALHEHDDGSGAELYAGGPFYTAGSVYVERVAKWDGTNWSDLEVGMNDVIYGFESFDDGSGSKLYAGGLFTNAGGAAANYIARWNGSSWSPLGSGLDFRAYEMEVFDDGGGEALYVVGSFQNAGGAGANRIAKWDGAAWSPLGVGCNSTINTVQAFDDGSGLALYIGGLFTTAGGVTASRLAKWDGASWSAPWVSSGANGEIIRTAVFDDGAGPALIVAGAFTSIGGVSANRIAKWNGSTWTALGAGVNNEVLALEVFDAGDGEALYVGGKFTTAGAAPAGYVAKWDGSSWSPLGAGANNYVRALEGSASTLGNRLRIGGDFTTFDGDRSIYLADWACAGTPAPKSYCTAGTTTNGCIPTISGVGVASANAPSGFTIAVADVEGQKSGLLFYGVTGAHSSPWGGGSSSSLCVKAPTQRMGAQTSGGTAGACDGTLGEDWNAYRATHPGALGQTFVGGELVWAQAWFRDPPAPKTTNLSDGLMFVVVP